MLKSKIFVLVCLAFFSNVFGQSAAAQKTAAAQTAPTATPTPSATPESPTPQPSPEQITGKNPVIIIPGITGSTLVNPITGKTVWFSLRRDKEDDLRLPMTSNNPARDRDNLVAKDIIRAVKVTGFLPEVEVYQSLIDSLKARGYAEADWSQTTQATDVFYVFAYDWRRDNVESARLLIQKIEAVKRALKRPDLKFDILAHSMGGLIARYAAMYGAADLPPEGRRITPTWAGARHIEKILMFGTPNEGSFSAFDALINGTTVVGSRNLPFVDDFRPEDTLTIPSLFQVMPHPSEARFLDENLKPIAVDLYDPATWKKYGWGAVNDPKFLSKLKDAAELAKSDADIKPVEPGKDSNADDRIVAQTTSAQVNAYFATVLSRAKRFELALDAPTSRVPVQLYAYGGNCAPTLDAVVLTHSDKKDEWITLTDAHDIKTSDGQTIKKDDVRAAIFALGDGRVTQRSLLAGSASSKGGTETINKNGFPLASSFLACGLHTKLFLEKPIQDSFLSALVVKRNAAGLGNKKTKSVK